MCFSSPLVCLTQCFFFYSVALSPRFRFSVKSKGFLNCKLNGKTPNRTTLQFSTRNTSMMYALEFPVALLFFPFLLFPAFHLFVSFFDILFICKFFSLLIVFVSIFFLLFLSVLTFSSALLFCLLFYFFFLPLLLSVSFFIYPIFLFNWFFASLRKMSCLFTSYSLSASYFTSLFYYNFFQSFPSIFIYVFLTY